MKKRILLSILSAVFIQGLYAIAEKEKTHNALTEKNMVHNSAYGVQMHLLSNKMTVLVKECDGPPTIQVWFGVGSKNEKKGEFGFAHLLEHMAFKGTSINGQMRLSESDVNISAHKLSASTNAFTSYDYTGYLYNIPTQNYKEVFFILADCMHNLSLKDDHLNSEMKAVIQELKLNRDNYRRALAMEILGAMFPDHPYHHPVIGYKQDLFSVTGSDLRAFYQKHYWPNNATLVVVGDVKAKEVFALAEETFGKIPANLAYKHDEFYHNEDVIARTITLYRDVQQPNAVIAYAIPGTQAKLNQLIDVINLILGEGKASRLYRKLVDEMQLVTSLGSGSLMLFEHGIYFISFEPVKIEDTDKIITIIQQEIESIVKKGLQKEELTRAIKQAQMAHYQLLESNESMAYDIGQGFLATGDPDFAFKYLTESTPAVEKEIQDLLAHYFRAAIRTTGYLLPLPKEEKEYWKKLQQESDDLDAKILAARERTSPIEAPNYANKIKPKEAPEFNFPKSQSFTLPNGLKVLYHNRPNLPSITIALNLKAEDYYEPEDKAGIYLFVASMLTEGTEKYSAIQLAKELESRGMQLSIVPGHVSMAMLSVDFERGLELLEEILSRPAFAENEIEKIRGQLLANIKKFWDEPSQFATQLLYEDIYKCHPFSKRTMGTDQSIQKITRKDLIEYHKKFFTPNQATIAIVGDLGTENIKKLLEKTLAKWKGPEVKEIEFPPLKPVTAHEMVYPINRDQVVLCFAGLSVERKSADYDKLLLFDQIFGGGTLGSLHSKLYQLREQSGLFYNISGSLTYHASEEKGLALVKTKVSLDRLAEAEKVIKHTINTATQEVSDEEFKEARDAIVNSVVKLFTANNSIAQVFLFLDRYGFGADYFDKRNERLAKISKKEMIDAVKRVLNTSSMMELKVGRVEPKKDSCPADNKK